MAVTATTVDMVTAGRTPPITEAIPSPAGNNRFLEPISAGCLARPADFFGP
jgi:hypothetical protein